jgi:hypothetical protein
MRNFRILGLLPLLVTGLAIESGAAPAAEGVQAQGPGTVFHSVEAAVLNTMAYAPTKRFPAGRHHRARRRRLSLRRPGGVGPQHDALHLHRPLPPPPPRKRRRDLPRVQQVRQPTGRPEERDAVWQRPHNVDEKPPQHRPTFLLTPSLKAVAYEGTTPRTIVRVAAPHTTIGAVTNP